MGNKPTEQQNDSVIVTYPKPNTVVHSPLVIKGKAKGTWFFEGSFPITLYYGVHGDVASTHATAQGAWMTEDYVPFTATIEFPTPKWKEGDLVLERANQSGLEENNDEIKVPVRFR